jgi:hypothetical protein
MQDRKYFGMTIQQIGILIGLAVFACLLFGMTGFFILRKGLGGLQSQSPAITPTVQMTATPFALPTLTPTPTLTPVPYEQLIPNGWKQFKTALVEIWLPPDFKTTKKDADEELAALSSNSKNSLYKMRVGIAYEPLIEDSLDAYLDKRIAKMDPAIRVVDRKEVSLNSTEAVRLMLEGRIQTVDVNELAYIFQDGGTIWAVTYVAQINEFYDMLPSFEQSAKTFRVVK